MATVIEIKPGQGGQDAETFAGTLASQVASWARRQDMPAEVSTTTRAVTVTLPATPAGIVRWLSGVHRIQHVPPHRTGSRGGNGKRHTSYAVLVVLDGNAAQEIETPLRTDPKVLVRTARGHGPGGQHRNTSETAVTVRHADYPGIEVTQNQGRSQRENLDTALAELQRRITAAANLAAAARRNQARSEVEPDVAFTHSPIEGWVKHHRTGTRWPLRIWEQGRFDRPEAA